MQKLFKNIDELPVWNFLRVIKTEDLRYLLILEDYYSLPEIEDMTELNQAWEDISGQLIDINGINENAQDIFRIQKEIVLGKLNMMVSGDLSDYGIIMAKIKQFERLTNKNKKIDFEELIVEMEIHFKMQFDLQKMTVNILYKYINKYTNGRKSNH